MTPKRLRLIRIILAGTLLSQAAWTIPARAHEDEKPEKMEDGTNIIYSPTTPKWFPHQLGSYLPDWIDLDAAWVSQPMGNVSGGSEKRASYADQWAFNITLSSGLEKKETEKKEIDRWSLHSNFGLQLGNPAFADQISAEFAPQGIYFDQGFWLRGLFIERDSEHLVVRAGPGMTMNNLIDSPTYAYYVTSIINNTLNLQVPGLPIDPYNSIGASVDLKIKDNISLKYGAFQLSSNKGQNTSSANTYKGFNFGVNSGDGVVQALKLEYAYMPSPTGLKVCLDREKEGLYTRANANCKNIGAVENNLPKPLVEIGGYTAGWQFPYLNGSDQTGGRTSGLFLDGIVPIKLPFGHGTSLWASTVFSSNKEINQVPFEVMGGLITQGIIPYRPFDQLVLGLSRTSLSPYSTYPAYTPDGSAQNYTATAELDYVIKLNDRFSIEPGIQFIFNPSGNNDYRTVIAPGIQFALAL